MKTFEEHYKYGLGAAVTNPDIADLVKKTASLYWDRALLEVLEAGSIEIIPSLLTEQPKQPGDF